MRRLLTPIPIAVMCALLALVALLAYGLASNEPDREVEEALAQGERPSWSCRGCPGAARSRSRTTAARS